MSVTLTRPPFPSLTPLPAFGLVLALLGPLGSLKGQTFLASNGATYETCAGLFYDTGGPTGNYGNSQIIVTTICPAGGSGSGPLTSVSFTQWVVAGGGGDLLRIYDGATTAGTLLVEGSVTNSLNGLNFTATDPSGCLTFEWLSNASGVAAGWTAVITTGPNAGTNASTTVCSNGAPFNMRTLLGGTPDVGGSWGTPLGTGHSSTYDPAQDDPGVWTYTVSGPAPCPDSVATLTISEVLAANAGTNGSVVLCSNSSPVSLFSLLGGTPNAGGTWTGPGGAHSGTFNPATDLAGTYTYTVAGTSPCPSASATVQVAVNTLPNAGVGTSTSVCSNGVPFDLFALLGGTPQAGGAWTGPGGTPVSSTYTPGVSTPGNYTYTVVGLPPCPNATAVINVVQVTAPNAGGDRSITVCSDDASFAMVGQLNGSPDAGGAWSGPLGPHGPTFAPSSDPGGAYTYTVAGTAPCANDQSVLTITVRQAPDAGTSGTTTVCSTAASFSLFTVLGGSPDAGGTWTAPGGAVHPGTFIPGTSTPGTYTYTVVGLSPCDPASATVLVSVVTAPVAGTGTSVTRCSNAAPFSLFVMLGGSPNAGGSWTGPLGAHSGTFTPGVDLPGPYTYTVAGTAPCANASAVVNVTIVTAPNAGSDGAITVCSDHAPFSLFALLGGSPDPTGGWTGPGNTPSNGTFTPGTSTPGAYTYTVPGQAPCTNDASTVTVTVVQAPQAGTNGSITVCSDAPPVNLFALLGGSPQSGGSWTAPGGGAHSGTYLPASQLGGTYTYTVLGTTPCANATASVQVARVIAPNAGTNGTITVCSTNSAFQLISVLGGSPNGSGSWINNANAAVGGTFTPGITPPGVYRYIVPATAPCVNDTAQVTVNVNTAPDAGANATITVCSSDAAFPLFNVLGGTPDAGGSWTRPNGTAHSGTFTPGQSIPGGYTYSVPGLTPCLSASAVVVVNVNQQPNAGTGGSFTRCSTDAPVTLFDLLGGSPQTGGAWTGPDGPSNGIFVPGTSTPGNYTYTVLGAAPCANATATLTAIVNQAPNAGIGGTLTVCGDQGTIDLFDALGGTPDATGAWNDDDATGQLSGQFFDPTGLPPGDYDFTYTVPGIGQCVAASAVIRVTLVGLLDAGTSGTMSVCGSNNQVDLFNGLGGSPQPGGLWLDLNGTGALSGNVFNATLVGPGIYVFRYRLQGTVACASDSAQTTVTVVAAPNPGTNGQVTVCSNAPSFGLFAFLGGSPQTGGIWRRDTPTGPMFSGTYNPSTNFPGVFYYIVNGSGPCPNAWATVTVSEVQAPSAGSSSTTTVCSSSAPFFMTNLLGGDPDPGTWFFGGVPHGNNFVPGLDLQGVYEYRVQGQAPFCADAISTLTISVVNASNAGCSGSRTVCSSDTEFLLFTAIGCSPSFGGSWLGPDLTPHDGVFTPGSSEPGDYRYIVAGSGPCPSDTAVVSVFVNPAPNAGLSSATTVCSSGGQVNLITVLGGAPEPSGSWVGPAPSNPPFSGIFVPGVSSPGVYTYTVNGAFPCPASVSSSVTVSVSQPPNAGISSAITRCSNSPGFPMVDQLLGTPAFNGTWIGPAPGNGPSNGFFTPGTSTPGVYTYTVPGTAPCANASATLNINVNPQANAGNDASLSVCSTSGAQPLFPLLGPSAQPGGVWTYQATGAVHSGTFIPAVDQAGTYVYTVPGLSGCTNDLALVTVVLNQAPNAGFNGSVTICDDQDPFLLFNALNGSPQGNGSWTAPGGATHTGIFLPATDPGGVYTYTVPGQGVCASAFAQVTVIKNEAPDAGGNGVLTICSSQQPVDLFDVIAGTPDSGGEWSAPGGAAFSGTYVPGVSAPGAYVYVLNAGAPCVNDTSLVTVVEYTAPDAGFSTVALICSDTATLSLIDLLGGQPDLNGTWSINSVAHPPFYDPLLDASGSYVYTVEGIAPCINAVAQVQITEVAAPNAGDDGTMAACVDAPAINLYDGLAGQWQTGGTWNDDAGTGMMNNGVFNATGVLPGAYPFTYTLSGSGPCSSASATVTVNLVAQLNAGEETTAQICESQGSVLLFDLLLGSPQAGGSWTDVDGSSALLGGVFDPALAGEGVWRFDYVLTASAACPSDTARLTVNVLEGPFAGCDGASTQCSNFPPFNLATALGCGPDAGGQWYKPDWTVHSGTFVPASDPAGIYHYVVPGIGACPSDSSFVNVQVVPAPNAGTDVNVSICSTDVPLALFGLLGNDAQAGGSWVYVTGGNTAHSGVYNPAVDAPGIYRYRVLGQSPCAADFAFVTVSEPLAADAGCNSLVSLCSDQAPVNMRLQLGCAPQTGGTWEGPAGPHSEFFDPSSDAPGIYTYTVEGVAPCANASATLTVAVTTASNAGQSALVPACSSQTAIDLFDALGPLADEGGTWTDVGNSGALTGQTFNPSVAGNGSWLFIYAFQANGPCPATSSQVTVNVGGGANAGADSSVTVCGGDTDFNLFEALGGTPDAGGIWVDQQGTGALLPGGILNAGLLPPGTTAGFTYEIVDPGCGPVSATVIVTTSIFPDPGGDGQSTLCVSSDPLDLFALLQGSPDPGGTWTDPSGALHSGTFDPGSDVSGPYAYTVQGNSFCPDSVAVVSMSVEPLPDAGTNGELFACDTLLAFDLFPGLGGTPMSGGTWIDLDGSGGLSPNGLLNTTGIPPGEYYYRYVVSVATCGDDSALVKVQVADHPEVLDVELLCNVQQRTYTVTFTIAGGDPSTYAVSGIEGALSDGPTHVFTSVPLVTSATFEAFVSDQYQCDVIRVAGESPCSFDTDVFVPQAFSPNNDGTNDLLIIPGIEGFPANTIRIFNRWGASMYESSGYDNRSVVWDGSSPDGAYSGTAPSGTYFYVLDLGNGAEALTGYIYLNR